MSIVIQFELVTPNGLYIRSQVGHFSFFRSVMIWLRAFVLIARSTSFGGWWFTCSICYWILSFVQRATAHVCLAHLPSSVRLQPDDTLASTVVGVLKTGEVVQSTGQQGSVDRSIERSLSSVLVVIWSISRLRSSGRWLCLSHLLSSSRVLLVF